MRKALAFLVILPMLAWGQLPEPGGSTGGGGGGTTYTQGDGIAISGSTISVDTAYTETRANNQANGSVFVTTGGTSTAYSAALNPALTGAYAAGQRIVLKMHTASGATPTLNVDSQGAKGLCKYNGTSAPSAIGANELQTTVYAFVYDAAALSSSGCWVTAIGGGGTDTDIIPDHFYPIGNYVSGIGVYHGTPWANPGGNASVNINAGVAYTMAGLTLNATAVYLQVVVPSGWTTAGTVKIQCYHWNNSAAGGSWTVSYDTLRGLNGTATGSPATDSVTVPTANTFTTGALTTLPEPASLVSGDILLIKITSAQVGSSNTNYTPGCRLVWSN